MFVAVLPPARVRRDLADACTRLPLPDGVRWTDPAQFHVTLAFIPDVPPRRLDRLTDLLHRRLLRHNAFDAHLTGFGAFPRRARARILWGGVDPQQELGQLSTTARRAALRAETPPATGSFRAHITVGRTRAPVDSTEWLDTHRVPEHSWRVESAQLVQSLLGQGPGGTPRYEIVAELPLTERSNPSTVRDESRHASPRE